MPESDVALATDATDVSATSDQGASGAAETVDTSLPAEGVQQPEVAVKQTAPEVTPTPAGELPAGQTLPTEFRALLKDPNYATLAPKLQSLWDRLQAYTSSFPAVADAKEFVTAFPGGVKDAIVAQQRAMELDEVDSAYFSRDPAQHAALAQDWAKNDPEAFAMLVEQSAGVLADTNPQAYQAVGNKILEGTLVNLYQIALATGNQEAAQRLDQLMKDVFGRGIREPARVDPREQQFKQQEEALKRRETEHETRVATEFANSSNQEVGGKLLQQIQSDLAKALTGVKVTDGAKSRIAQDIYDDINKKLIADRGLQTRLQSIAQAGKRSSFTDAHRQQWVNAIYSRAIAMLPASAKSVIDGWTQEVLGVAASKSAKITSAASRKDVGGGGLPNYSQPPLTWEKAKDMTNAEILAYQGPISPDIRQKMREGKFAPPPRT